MSCGDLVHGSEPTRGRHEGIHNITIVSRRVPKVLIRKNAIRACSGASTFKVPGGGSNPPAPPPGPSPTLRCPFLGPNFPPSSDPRPSVLPTCWGFLLPPPSKKKKTWGQALPKPKTKKFNVNFGVRRGSHLRGAEGLQLKIPLNVPVRKSNKSNEEDRVRSVLAHKCCAQV